LKKFKFLVACNTDVLQANKRFEALVLFIYN